MQKKLKKKRSPKGLVVVKTDNAWNWKVFWKITIQKAKSILTKKVYKSYHVNGSAERRPQEGSDITNIYSGFSLSFFPRISKFATKKMCVSKQKSIYFSGIHWLI